MCLKGVLEEAVELRCPACGCAVGREGLVVEAPIVLDVASTEDGRLVARGGSGHADEEVERIDVGAYSCWQIAYR